VVGRVRTFPRVLFGHSNLCSSPSYLNINHVRPVVACQILSSFMVCFSAKKDPG
jgi:hypothetical protein